MINDLRGWLEYVDKLKEIKQVNEADWDLEIGAITEMVHKNPNAPALLFDRIPGCQPGFRMLTNTLGSIARLALTCGLPLDLNEQGFVREWKTKLKTLNPIKPRLVEAGPVLTNVQTGDQVNLFQFPAPKWHEEDGGRYLGTGSVDITVDPDDGSVNLGTYRVMLIDRNHVSFYISPGKDGWLHRQKYFDRGMRCPVAISLGHHPLIYLVGSIRTPTNFTEYEFAGAIAGHPIDVINAPLTGIPIPATAEIVLEGEAAPDWRHPEGPFGEWTGYYGSGQRPEPVIEVKAIYYRDNPIVIGSPPGKPPYENVWAQRLLRAVEVEEGLARAGVPDVTGVWLHEAGGCHLFMVIGLKQRYPGHARQAALAATSSKEGVYMGRYIVVVDEDIDITDLNDVLWAICTRTDPAQSIEILHRCLGSPLDPMMQPHNKGFNSRAIIDACRPYEWKDEFPHVATCSQGLMQKIRDKWGHLLS